MRTLKNDFLLFILTAATASAQGVFSSVEQFNYQIGAETTALRDYEGFDELSDLPGVTGYTFSVNGSAPETITANPEFDGAFKRRLSYATLPEMLAARPVDGTYVHTLTGDPEEVVTITGPGILYETAIPVDPRFTFTGVSGVWTQDAEGMGVFNFDPTGITSFTLTMNLFSASLIGDAFVSGISVAEIDGAFIAIDDVSSDIQLNGEAATQLSITFTQGLPVDGGDADPSTYGFELGSLFEIEGEFVNVFFEDGYGLDDDLLAAFVYQNVTGFKIQASPVPEPASAAALGIAALYLAACRRRNPRSA